MSRAQQQLMDATLDQLVDMVMSSTDLSWTKTWVGAGVPTNYTTGHRYRNSNILILSLTRAMKNYSSNYWAGYKQWEAAGYQVAKGERSTVIFAQRTTVKEDEETGEKKVSRFFKCQYVYNVDQLVEAPVIEQPDPPKPDERYRMAMDLCLSNGVTLADSYSPMYITSHDVVAMPNLEAFKSSDAYCATLFHELVHWTGAKHRLDRFSGDTIHAYAFEELCAELGCVMLCSHFGVEEIEGTGHENSAAYLQGWLKKFPPDKRAEKLLAASTCGWEAFNYLTEKPEKETP